METFKNNRKRILMVIVLVVAICVMGVNDYYIIRRIQDKTTEEYVSYGYGSTQISVNSGTLEITFRPVAPKIQTLSLCGTVGLGKEDTIQYEILNENQESLFQSEKMNLDDVYRAENERLLLDCNNITFQEGKEYKLRVISDTTEPMILWKDQDGMVCAQEYVVGYQNFLYGLLLAINLLAIGFVLAFLRWKWNDKLFLTMSLSVGVLAVVLTVPFARDDEFRHFLRAYDLATDGEYFRYGKPYGEVQGVIALDDNGEGAFIRLPKELDDLRRLDYCDDMRAGGYLSEINLGLCLPKLLSILKQPEVEGTVWVSEAATYGRTIYGYWPQVLMIKLGRALGVRSLFLYYLACLGQVIAVSIIFWISMRLTDTKKNMIWFASFIPVSIVLFSSANSDGLMIAEVVLCLSIILHVREQGGLQMNRSNIFPLAMYLFTVYNIYTNKFPYALLCLGFLPLLIKHKPNKKVMGLFSGIVAIGVVLLIWKRDLLSNVLHNFISQSHLEYWESHFVVISSLMLQKGKELLSQTWHALDGGTWLGYHTLALVVLLLSKRCLGWVQKCYQCMLFFGMLGIIVLFGYTLTPPDYGEIWGVTYRYILPFLPLTALILPVGTEKTENMIREYYPVLFVAVVFAFTTGFGIF